MKFLYILLFFTPLAFAKENLHRNHAEAGSIQLAGRDWSILFSSGVPKHPSLFNGGGGWHFNFPSTDGWVGYITTTYTKPIIQGHVTLLIQIKTTGQPIFGFGTESWNVASNGCVNPATVRAFIERLNADVYNPRDRWWSNPISFTLAQTDGVFITTPFTPDQWSDVNGEQGNSSLDTMSAFEDVLANPGAVGMTFGGGCTFGHGVNTSGGTAEFVLNSYSLW